MSKPLISVIVPVYNVESYLRRCVFSLTTQQYTNLEIVLINDGSIDSSGEIAEQLAQQDKRIRVIHQENKGLSGARNTGLKAITGEYVFFLDSDDWLEKDALSYLYETSVLYDADIVVGGIQRNRVEEEPLEMSALKTEILTQEDYAKRYFKIAYQGIEYYVWNKLYKRRVVENVVYPEGFYAEDVPTTFQYILNATKIVVSHKIIIHYFINTMGLTATFTARHFDVLKGWQIVCEKAKESHNEKYMKWADFNYKRAHFALLTEMILSPRFNQLKTECQADYENLVVKTLQYKKELLASSMPLNRKVVLFFYGINFAFFSKCIHNFAQLIKRTSK